MIIDVILVDNLSNFVYDYLFVVFFITEISYAKLYGTKITSSNVIK